MARPLTSKIPPPATPRPNALRALLAQSSLSLLSSWTSSATDCTASSTPSVPIRFAVSSTSFFNPALEICLVVCSVVCSIPSLTRPFTAFSTGFLNISLMNLPVPPNRTPPVSSKPTAPAPTRCRADSSSLSPVSLPWSSKTTRSPEPASQKFLPLVATPSTIPGRRFIANLAISLGLSNSSLPSSPRTVSTPFRTQSPALDAVSATCAVFICPNKPYSPKGLR